MNAKNTKKPPIHEDADASITCDFGDGDISRSRSRFTHTHGQAVRRIASSIIVRCPCLSSCVISVTIVDTCAIQ